MNKKAQELLQEIKQDFQNILAQLEKDVYKLFDYIAGTYIPKLSKKYILDIKNNVNHRETFINAYKFVHLPINTYVSANRPIMLLSVAFGKALQLVPFDKEYIILKPGADFKLSVVGKEGWYIYVKLDDTPSCDKTKMKIQKAFISNELLYDAVDFPVSSIRKIYNVQFIRNCIKQKQESGMVDIDKLLAELNENVASVFLDFEFIKKIWAKAIVLEDIEMFSAQAFTYKMPASYSRKDILKIIQNNFDEFLETVSNVQEFEG